MKLLEDWKGKKTCQHEFCPYRYCPYHRYYCGTTQDKIWIPKSDGAAENCYAYLDK